LERLRFTVWDAGKVKWIAIIFNRMLSVTWSMGVNRTSILVIIVAGALTGFMAMMSLQQASRINTSTQNINLDSSGCNPGSTCNNTASTSINFVGTSDNKY
jgi:hypothetical protein